jgi:hypothetical protein
MCFTRATTEIIDLRHDAGISLIFWTVFLVCFNIYLIAAPAFKTQRLKCKRKWLIKRALKIK